MDGAIFPKITPIYKEIKASKRLTKKRIAKSLSRYTEKPKDLSKIFKNGQ